jgi:two-component system response regulator AtoC
VCVNCGAIPESLITSTLFGAEKGAFTGADQKKLGIFESADKGTVFLDEIGELPESAQSALLRVLEIGKVTRVGGTREIPVDVRIVAATHRDLEEMVEEGQFREDLLYRLNALTLRVPPLRERPADITALTERFLAGVGGLHIGEDAMAALRAYSWPGNVRELRNAIERAAVLARGPTITFPDLPDRVRGGALPASAKRDGGGAASPNVAPRAPFKVQLRLEERRILLDALQRADGVQKDAAELLSMPLRTFVYKLKQLGIRRKRSGYEIDDDDDFED